MTKPPNTTCTSCGTEYYRSPSVVARHPNQKNTFCSIECKTYYNTDEINCLSCGTPFRQARSLIRQGKPIHLCCSDTCHQDYRSQFDVIQNCSWCGREYQSKRYLEKYKLYCSKDCSRASLVHQMNERPKTGDMVTCPNCDTENYFPKNRIDAGAKFCNSRCYGEWLVKTGARSGENNNAYNPSLTDEDREDTRMTPEHHDWRIAVFKRDDYTCVKCGTRGGELNAHHKNAYHAYPEQRYDVSNGSTLCVSCHRNFHTDYGFLDNTEQQFNEYLRL